MNGQSYEEVYFTESKFDAAERMNKVVDEVAQDVLAFGAKPCFATIPTVSFYKWNVETRLLGGHTSLLLHSHQYDDMQEMLNYVTEEVNHHIVKTNVSNNMMTPDLAATIVEKRKDTPTRYHYSRMHDGVHPTNTLRRKWAKKLQRAIDINRRYDNPIDYEEYEGL